jgi:hypothetical protein
MRFSLLRLFGVMTLASLYMAAVYRVMSLFGDNELSFSFRLVYAFSAVFIVFGLPGVIAGMVVGKVINRTADGVMTGAVLGLVALALWLGLSGRF